MKKTLSKYPYIGLLNFEGDVLRIYKLAENSFVIVDDYHNHVEDATVESILEFVHGKRNIQTANRSWNYLNEHKNAKPDYDVLLSFLMGK